jgi:Holliday junction DNA helicase RuvA
VREDDLSLIGFFTEEERALFRKLIGISGIGPATAMSVLSGFTTADFIRAVQTGDLKTLTRVKGLGKKTAERLVVELRDSFNKLEGFASDKNQAPELRVCADAVMALIQLGYLRKDAEEKVNQAFRDNSNATVEDLIKLSLK